MLGEDKSPEALKAFIEFTEELAKDEDRKKVMARAHKQLLEITEMLQEYGVSFMLSGGMHVNGESETIVLAGMTSSTAQAVHGIHRQACILAEARLMEKLNEVSERLDGSDD